MTEFSAALGKHPNEGDDLDDEDRARLHAALDRADQQLKAGRFVSGADVIARLRRNAE
jgi:hypothetical protein